MDQSGLSRCQRDERRRSRSISRVRHRPLLSSKTFPGLPPENRRCLKREPQAQIGGVGGLSLLNICLCLNMTGIPSLFALLSVSPFVRRPNRELELFPVAIHLSLRLLRLKEQEGERGGTREGGWDAMQWRRRLLAMTWAATATAAAFPLGLRRVRRRYHHQHQTDQR